MDPQQQFMHSKLEELSASQLQTTRAQASLEKKVDGITARLDMVLEMLGSNDRSTTMTGPPAHLLGSKSSFKLTKTKACTQKAMSLQSMPLVANTEEDLGPV